MCLTLTDMYLYATNLPAYAKPAVSDSSAPPRTSRITPEQKKIGLLLYKSFFSVVFFCKIQLLFVISGIVFDW